MKDLEKLLEKEMLSDEERRQICNELMTTESRMEKLILRYFTVESMRTFGGEEANISETA